MRAVKLREWLIRLNESQRREFWFRRNHGVLRRHGRPIDGTERIFRNADVDRLKQPRPYQLHVELRIALRLRGQDRVVRVQHALNRNLD